VVTGSVGDGRARAAQAYERTLGQAFEISIRQRRIGCNDNHDGACVGSSQRWRERILIDLFPDRHAVDREQSAVVRLHDDTDRVAIQTLWQASRARSDASLQTER